MFLEIIHIVSDSLCIPFRENTPLCGNLHFVISSEQFLELFLNPLQPGVAFLYLLKASENLKVS